MNTASATPIRIAVIDTDREWFGFLKRYLHTHNAHPEKGFGVTFEVEYFVNAGEFLRDHSSMTHHDFVMVGVSSYDMQTPEMILSHCPTGLYWKLVFLSEVSSYRFTRLVSQTSFRPELKKPISDTGLKTMFTRIRDLALENQT